MLHKIIYPVPKSSLPSVPSHLCLSPVTNTVDALEDFTASATMFARLEVEYDSDFVSTYTVLNF